MKIGFLLVLLFIQSNAYSVYSPESYGEKNFSEYHGSRDLIYRVDPFSGKVIFEEKELFENYGTNLIQQDLDFFQKFFFSELSTSLSCPESELTKMYDYLRFTNRVLTLSYLYENINLRHVVSKKLNNNESCKVDWESILNSCNPQSNDMKFFVKSAKHISKNRKKFHLSSSTSLKSFQRNWVENLKQKKYNDVAQFRLAKECFSGRCRTLDLEGILGKLNKTCQQDETLFKKICSEKDRIYGLHYIQESYPLIINSDILEIADDNGFAAGCLRRFKYLTKTKEAFYPELKLIFPITYSEMVSSKRRYVQGDLFPAGTLKKFVDMGLKELFKEKKVKVVKKTPIIKEKKVIELPVEDKIEFIDRFVKKKRKKKKKKKIIAKKKKKLEVKKSSFLAAVELQKQIDANKVKVDMLKFRYDFLFSLSLQNILDESLQNYMSREGLNDMREGDSLGMKKGPMPLMFLKYLIETEKHQALYNLISIVGDEFYVKNDIDKKTSKYNYIQLVNDSSTNYVWQIYILRPKDK